MSDRVPYEGPKQYDGKECRGWAQPVDARVLQARVQKDVLLVYVALHWFSCWGGSSGVLKLSNSCICSNLRGIAPPISAAITACLLFFHGTRTHGHCRLTWSHHLHLAASSAAHAVEHGGLRGYPRYMSGIA